MRLSLHRSVEDARPLLFGFGLLAAVLGFFSAGGHHDDDVVHYLMARWSWWHPDYLLHHWGRPGLTIPLAAVAWMGDASTGWHTSRLVCTIAAVVAAMLAADLAGRLGAADGRRASWVCFGQPLFMLLSFTTLTESFAALYLAAAVWLFYQRRFVTASAIFSLALVTRHEMLALTPIWGWAILTARETPGRRAGGVLLSFWAPVVHQTLFYWRFGVWPLAFFTRPTGSTEYAAAGLLGYLPQALWAVTPLIAVLATFGALTLLERGQWLIAALAGGYLFTHVVVCAGGWYAGGGFARFMVAVAPLVAPLAAVGWGELAQRRRQRRPLRLFWGITAVTFLLAAWNGIPRLYRLIAHMDYERMPMIVRLSGLWERYTVVILAAATATLLITGYFTWAYGRRAGSSALGLRVLTLLAILQWLVIVRPLPASGLQELARAAAADLRHDQPDSAPVFAACPWFAYYLGHVENPRAHKDRRLLASMPEGTLFIWDSVYSDSDFHGLGPVEAYEESPAFEFIRGYGDYGLKVFRKRSEPQALEAPVDGYPPPLTALRAPVNGVFYTLDKN